MNDVKVFKNPKNVTSDLVITESEFLSGTGGAFADMELGTFIRDSFSSKSPYEL